MKSILTTILTSILLLSCSAKKEISTTPTKPKLNLEFSESPIDIGSSSASFVQDLAYHTHANNILDIFIPDTKLPTPLVIYIHGGGFTHGEKERVYDRHADVINSLLENNIAFATIGYRFLQHSDRGVIQSLEDSKTALQYLRYHAESFNIDKTKVASFGSSAGAGTSLWLGLSDDMAIPSEENIYSGESTRLLAVGALETQGTYDILRWEEVFESYSIDMSRVPKPMMDELAKFYGLDDAQLLYNEENTNYRSKVDFLKLMSSDDPPLYIKNMGKDGPPFFTDIQHHPLHAKILKTYADRIGIDNIVSAPNLDMEDATDMGLIDFFLLHLK